MRTSCNHSKSDSIEVNNPKLLKNTNLQKNHNCDRNALHMKNINNQLTTLKSESVSSSSKSNFHKKSKAVKNNNSCSKLKENYNKSESPIKKNINSSNKENNVNLNKVVKNGYDLNSFSNNKYYFDNKKNIMKRSLQTLCYSRLRNQDFLCASTLSLGIPQPKRKHILYE